MKRNKNMKKDNGITLISLVITIIVLIILTAIVINQLVVGKLIGTTAGATQKYELAEAQEAIYFYLLENIKDNKIKYMTPEEISKNVPGLNYGKGKLAIYNGEIVYLGDEESEEGIHAKELGMAVKNMNSDEFRYYIELGVLADKVLMQTENIGRELMTVDFENSITIGSVTYDLGWFLIGNYTEEEKASNKYDEQFEKLGLTDTTHAPYLVNYQTGEVLSIEGMEMYESRNKVYSFNLRNSSSTLDKSIMYVDSMTERGKDHFGSLKAYGGDLTYDEDGALILGTDKAYPYIEIDNKYTVDKAYSISITVKGDTSQSSRCISINAMWYYGRIW